MFSQLLNYTGHYKTSDWGKRFLMLCAVILSASLAFAGSNKVASDLQDEMSAADPNATVDVIVQYVSKPGNTQFAKVLKKNGIVKNHLDVVNGAAFTVPVSLLSNLASDPNVAYITPDRTVQGTSNGNPTATLDYYDATTNATSGWQSGYTGTGIGVAIIDSGIASTSDLGPRVVYLSLIHI